jgi:hypothetical protein
VAAVTLALWPALLLASGAATLAQQVAQPAPGGIVRDGPPPDLALMYTGDVIGFLDPCG